MSDFIDMLERLGQDARLHDATPADIEWLLQEAGAPPEVAAAIVSGDYIRVQSLLSAGGTCCLIWMPRENEVEESSPSKVNPVPDEEELVPAFSNHRRVA
jgi:hypothetical protein